MTTRHCAFLTDAVGSPKLISLAVRESTTAPARLKATFVASAEEGVGARNEEGELHVIDLPEAANAAAIQLATEFRLEMN